MTQFDFENLASQMGLELIETTSEFSGYPRNLKKAIIGFESFEEANELAQEHDLSIEVFHKRDGWNQWHRSGGEAYEPFTLTTDHFGTDYQLYTKGDDRDYYENDVKELISDFDSFEEVEKFLKERREVYDAICQLGEDEAVVTCEGALYEVIKTRTMSYCHDTHHYAIGLIDENNED